MSIGAVALAGVVWLGSGVAGGALRGAEQVSPAGMVWEVDEPASVTLLDGERLDDGRTWRVTLSKDPSSSTATFVIDGEQHVVDGQPSTAGPETFATEHGTLVVWGSTEATVTFVPELAATLAGAVSGERGAVQWALLRHDHTPDDILLNDADSVWTASGRVADMAPLKGGGVRLMGVALPGLGIAGYLDDGAFYEVDTLTVSSVERPWWRGGRVDVVGVARLPEEAVLARVVLRDEPGGQVVQTSPTRQTVGVGDCDLVLLPDGWLGGTGDEADRVADVQWSHDGLTWHAQDPEAPAAGADLGPVGPGGKVVLLDETYEVGTDAHGWPQLLDEDGSVFLTVSDAEGPPAGEGGGIVMWREHWWPWSDRNEVHFAVDAQPRLGSDVDGQDAVTVSGPAGVVGLVAVPAGS